MSVRRALSIALAGLVVCATATGCSDPGARAGFGLPTLDPPDAEEIAGTAAEQLYGAVAVESNGCFTWRADEPGSDPDGAWIVWPDGAHQDDDEVVLATGEVGDGDPVAAIGAVVEVDDLPGGSNADSYFGSFARFCGADETGVLVLTEAEPGGVPVP
ncbi:hypothetical protein GCM10010460_15260 [Microbacterium terrae]|uniref:Lipoprotein n=1 Tax=Microbacterium terrae TaxID=69369 RepID=A0A0M2H4F1_9MICO|nr:hypothetical protein RS81_02830 [Microbacterium terrae]GLJ98201.1 hypothetical protein GCM10017594_13980 [Microbacterium terrae]